MFIDEDVRGTVIAGTDRGFWGGGRRGGEVVVVVVGMAEEG